MTLLEVDLIHAQMKFYKAATELIERELEASDRRTKEIEDFDNIKKVLEDFAAKYNCGGYHD